MTFGGAAEDDWTAGRQAVAQAAGRGGSLLLALIGGLLSGALIRQGISQEARGR